MHGGWTNEAVALRTGFSGARRHLAIANPNFSMAPSCTRLDATGHQYR
jgi:hypothetical protein